METLPENIDQVERERLYLSVLMLGKRGDCPDCEFKGNPERLEFINTGEDAVYCSECGHRIPDERIEDTPKREDRLPIS